METKVKRPVGRPPKGHGPSKSSDAADARWTVRGVPVQLRAVANAAADESGITVGDWLNEAIVAYAKQVGQADLLQADVAAAETGSSHTALTYWNAGGGETIANDAAPMEIIAEWFDVEDAPLDDRPGWTKRGQDRDFGWVIEDIHRRLVRVENRRPPSPLGGIFRRRP